LWLSLPADAEADEETLLLALLLLQPLWRMMMCLKRSP